MAEVSLLGKRKKVIPKCPNPLFVKWLTEWRDEAANKAMKSQHTYGKALQSLKKYPIPLQTGQECKFLEHFGDKICKMLDEKLAQHMASNGGLDLEDEGDADTLPDILLSSNKRPRTNTLQRTGSTCHSISSGSDDEQDAPRPPATCYNGNVFQRTAGVRRNSAAAGREYMPQYRSGAYALLVTLHRHTQKETRGFMGKKELMREAQPLSNKSFSIPDPGSRYTAWSSMGTLIKKALVVKSNSPARYSLTQEGSDLSIRLLAIHCETPNSPCVNMYPALCDGSGFGQRVNRKVSPVRQISQPLVNRVTGGIGSIISADSGSDSECELLMLSPSHSMSSNETSSQHKIEKNDVSSPVNAGFKFTYVTENNQEVREKDKAAVHVDDDVGFLILANYGDLLDSGKQYHLDTTRWSDDGRVYAYIYNADAPDTCSPAETTHKNMALSSEASDDKTSVCSSVASGKGSLVSGNLHLAGSCDSSQLSTDVSDGLSVTLSRDSATSSSKSSQSWNASIPKRAVFSALIRPAESDSMTDADMRSLDSGNSETGDTVLSMTPHFTLYPRTFDVVLCVDNCEMFGGGSKGAKETLIRELQKNLVKFEARKLQVGDFCWVAREKGTSSSSQEVVLEYIIERKRMDDLASSIVDGRFREQKYRLKNCGVPNAVYLVEDYGSTKNLNLPESTLLQAVTNTQVIDGFHVKRTRDTRESAAYLTLMTRHLQTLYSGKTLVACSKKEVEGKSKEKGQLPGAATAHLMTFNEFNQASVKNRPLTVREMFGKHLVQLHGLTAEKAAAVINKYPTIASLMEAFKAKATEKERELLISNIRYGPLARNVGNNIGKTLAMMYTLADNLP